MEQLVSKSLALHELYKGKLETKSKVPIVTKADLALAYTPGVADVSREIAAHPDSVWKYTIKQNTVAVVSDGSAVLGLGNIGPEAALPVMEGKAALFKTFANIDAFPICLNIQNTNEIVETILRIAPVFGGINLEDISAPRCFEIERRLRSELNIPVMHDDQHGTAVVVLAALINALRVKGIDSTSARIVINGAGAAGTAVANLLHLYGFTNMVVCDSKGIISLRRDDINNEKRRLLEISNSDGKSGNLTDALKTADVFIGLSKGGALKPELIKSMSPNPIIFAMANPTPEITPEEAKAFGALVVATGRSDFPNQVNNVLAFPGIFRGALDGRISQFSDEMFLAVATSLAALISEPSREHILPDVFDSRIVETIAMAIKSYGVKK